MKCGSALCEARAATFVTTDSHPHGSSVHSPWGRASARVRFALTCITSLVNGPHNTMPQLQIQNDDF